MRVTALHVTGQTLYPEADLIAATHFTPGHDMTLGELRVAASQIAAFYNARGYFLAQAYLPEQNISGGEVAIVVVEGRYGKIKVDNRSRLSTGLANDILAGVDAGDVAAIAPLERRLLLLSDVPGVRVKSTLAPGYAVGTSDLIVAITPAAPISGSVEADNAGNRYTGAYRLGGAINLNDPTGRGDMLSLRVLGSTGGLGYGRVAYQAPVRDAMLGIAFTHLHYSLGREFKSLDADGKADIASAFASYPVVRSRSLNLNALANVDARWLTDHIDVILSTSKRTSVTALLGFSGDSHDRSGWNLFAASVGFGDLRFPHPLERAADAASARSAGGFTKFEASAARLQTIAGPLALFASARGQLALNNLDSSEKMELGGAYAVRAYPEGEAYGDDGYIATIEARLALAQWTKALPGQFQLIAFVDAGEVRYAHDAWFAGSNHARRSGVGAGLNWAGPQGFSIRASYAVKLGNEAATSGPNKGGRAWFQISKLF